MKYSHKTAHSQKRPYDSDYHAQLGYRLRTARRGMGWSIEDAAKYFRVTERTWHNWESGAHRIPFAVYKLCRVLARLELPGDAWAGWSFQGSTLITPEGRQIEPKDSSWWSLMVRNAQSFSAAYNEATRLRLLVAQLEAAADDSGRQAQRAGSGAAAGLVPSKTNRIDDTFPASERHHDDVIMTSWPTLYDFPTPSTPLHAPKQTTSESALTPSFVSPWMPICGVKLTLQRPKPGPHLPQTGEVKVHLKQVPGNLPSSPEPKSKPSTRNESACSHASAMPVQAAKSAQLASTSRGTP